MDSWLPSSKETLTVVVVLLVIVLVIVLIICAVNAWGNGGGDNTDSSSSSETSSRSEYFGPPIENLSSNDKSPTIGTDSFTGGRDCKDEDTTGRTEKSTTSLDPLVANSDLT